MANSSCEAAPRPRPKQVISPCGAASSRWAQGPSRPKGESLVKRLMTSCSKYNVHECGFAFSCMVLSCFVHKKAPEEFGRGPGHWLHHSLAIMPFDALHMGLFNVGTHWNWNLEAWVGKLAFPDGCGHSRGWHFDEQSESSWVCHHFVGQNMSKSWFSVFWLVLFLKFCWFIRSLASAIGSDPKYRKSICIAGWWNLHHLLLRLMSQVALSSAHKTHAYFNGEMGSWWRFNPLDVLVKENHQGIQGLEGVDCRH